MNRAILLRAALLLSIAGAALAPLAVRAADPPAPATTPTRAPRSTNGELEHWPWRLACEGTVAAIAVEKRPAVKPARIAIQRPGQPGASIDLDEFPVYREGARVESARVVVGDRLRWWVCTSGAPDAPGNVLEVVPEPR